MKNCRGMSILGFILMLSNSLFAINDNNDYDEVKTEELKQYLDHLLLTSWQWDKEKTSAEDNEQMSSTIAKFIKSGANPNIAANHYGKFYLSTTSQSPNEVSPYDGACITAMFFAAYVGDKALIKILYFHGAYVDGGMPHRCPPSRYAVFNGHIDAMITLLELGANPSRAMQKQGNEIVCQSCFFQGNLDYEHWFSRIVRLSSNDELEFIIKNVKNNELLAFINQRNPAGITPLDIALITKNEKAVSLLLAAGANPKLGKFNANLLARWVPHWRLSLCKEIYQAYEKQYMNIFDSVTIFSRLSKDLKTHITYLVILIDDFYREHVDKP